MQKASCYILLLYLSKYLLEVKNKDLRHFCSVFIIYMWRRGIVVITTAQLHSTEPELRFCAGSNAARGLSFGQSVETKLSTSE